jgi:cytoskeletal protein CcmA (bactofilin family)
MFKNKQETGTNVIGIGTEVSGKVKANGSMEILGRIEVTEGYAIESKDVVSILKDASIKGNISCIEVYLEGKVEGDIWAEHKVKLTKGCCLKGDIYANALSVEEGANFNGKVVINSDSNTNTQATKPTNDDKKKK